MTNTETIRVQVKDEGVTINGEPVLTEQDEQIRIAIMQERQFLYLQALERLEEEKGK